MKIKIIAIGLIICTGLTMSFTQQNNLDKSKMEKANILYVFDPLCGWCYGFEPVMMQFQEKYKDKVNLEVIPGGMVPKKYARPISTMRPFLEEAIPQLEKRTGITIAKSYYDSILYKHGVVLNSELPSQVFMAALESYKGREVFLAKEIQDLLYQKGKDISQLEVFSSIEGLDLTLLETEETTKKMNNAFARSRQLGVTSYPALLIEVEGKYYPLCNGYTDYEHLSKVTDKFLKQLNK